MWRTDRRAGKRTDFAIKRFRRRPERLADWLANCGKASFIFGVHGAHYIFRRQELCVTEVDQDDLQMSSFLRYGACYPSYKVIFNPLRSSQRDGVLPSHLKAARSTSGGRYNEMEFIVPLRDRGLRTQSVCAEALPLSSQATTSLRLTVHFLSDCSLKNFPLCENTSNANQDTAHNHLV